MKSASSKFLLCASILFLAVVGSVNADVKPNPLFSDGAVLQQGVEIPVWGTAAAGEKVTVSLDGQEASATADADGKWKVQLPSRQAGGPFVMTLSSGNKTIKLNDVFVGEVWVCSGQSNMEWKLAQAANAATEVPQANYPRIRMFTVPKNVSANPVSEAAGKWEVCTPATAPGYSAVGYFFARDLFKARSVPVGMIHSSWGGTPAEAWTSYAGLTTKPTLKFYTEALRKSVDGYFKSLESVRKTIDPFLAKYPEIPSTPPWPNDFPTNLPVNPFSSQNTPTVLYNGMIAPLIPYAIRGVIWYQGESNASQAKLYQTLFPAMIADWREKWGLGDFPFLFTQIAPFAGQPPEIRESQFLTLGKSAKTAMAVTTDVGDPQDIHPRKKEPVGQRLALAARALAYGESLEYSGPLFTSLKIDGSKAIVSFAHVGAGLTAQNGELKGFTIAGADGKFVPAQAEIVGETVVVSSPGVVAPTAVRYGWANVPDVNLFNKEGLPASPFRSDLPPAE